MMPSNKTKLTTPFIIAALAVIILIPILHSCGAPPPQGPPPSAPPPPPPTGQAPDRATALNTSDEALFEDVYLVNGFTPDPYTLLVNARGISPSPLPSTDCSGYINSSSPDVTFTYEAGDSPLTVSIRGYGTGLILHTPDKEFKCASVATEGNNPAIKIDHPESGEYAVWVLSQMQNEYVRAEMAISEQ